MSRLLPGLSPQGAWGKRGWNNLQGAWGKRADEDEDSGVEEVPVSPVILARLMAPSKRGWGKRPDYPPISPRSTNWSSLRGESVLY